MFIGMSQVVHIIQKLNIMSCIHSLHVDILESIYLGLWRIVSFTYVWHHKPRYIFNFTYQNNLNLNNITKAWCCSLPSIPLVPCTTLVPPSSPLNSVPEKFKVYLAIQYGTFFVEKILSVFCDQNRWPLSVEEAGSEKKISHVFPDCLIGAEVGLHSLSSPLCSAPELLR